MKKICLLLTVLVLGTNFAAASDNFLNPQWWSTATIEDVKKELAAGTDVNTKDNDSWTALMIAALNNENPDVIKALVDAGADVNAKSEDGLTTLMGAAAFNKNPDIIKTLVEAGADVKAKSEDGLTALVSAAENNNNSDVIRALIEAGADVNAKNDEGETALTIAQSAGNLEIAELLQNYEEFTDTFAECHSVQNIGSYANKFCKCAIKSAVNSLDKEDKRKAENAFNDARVGTFRNLIQKGTYAAFKECY